MRFFRSSQPAAPKPKARVIDEHRPQPRPVHETLLLGVTCPFFLFVLLILQFTYTYHQWPLGPWITVFLGVLFALLKAWPKYPGIYGYTPWSWYPLVACLGAMGLGIVVGHWNYENILPWIHSTSLREYSSVRPEMDPRSLGDAGTLRFAAGSMVDTDTAVGYRDWPTTYCAAPIVGVTPSDQVSFWAVGINCCASRQSFTCGDVKDPTARSGLKLQSHAMSMLLGHDVADNYRLAAQMAAGAYGLKMAADPIFVQWVADPVLVAEEAWWTATIFVVILFVIALFFAACAFWTVMYGTKG